MIALSKREAVHVWFPGFLSGVCVGMVLMLVVLGYLP